jgi:uncharacterized protein (UPF0264 family)
MKNNTTKKKGVSKGQVVAVGATVAAVAGAAYYFFGPQGKKHQKEAKEWTRSAKDRIVKEIKRAKVISESVYGDIVDDVIEPYLAKGVAAKEEVQAFAKALKKDWSNIVKIAKQNTKTESSKAKKVVRKSKAKMAKKVDAVS